LRVLGVDATHRATRWRRPVTDHAVNWAELRVARLPGAGNGARVASIARHGARLLTRHTVRARARLGAHGPVADRALASHSRVTIPLLSQGVGPRAGRTVGNGARLRLLARATLGRARRPVRPRADLANGRRTALRVAGLSLRQIGARRTHVSRQLRDGAGLCLHTAAALLRALRPRRPRTDSAVRALALHIGIASLRLSQFWAGLAAQTRLLRDGSSLRLDAAHTGCGGTRNRAG